MGKNWRGPRKGGLARKNANSDNSIGSCKGHGVIMATCDAAREREANKEIVTLVDMILEDWEATGEVQKLPEAENKGSNAKDSKDDSIADILAAEIAEARREAEGFKPKNSRIINTNIKGVVLVKITRQGCCPIKIVRRIFEKVKSDKRAYSRHIVRIIPLRYCFYPDEWDLVENVRKCVCDVFPGLQLPPINFSKPKEEREKRLVAKRVVEDAKEEKETVGEGGESSCANVMEDSHTSKDDTSNKRERESDSHENDVTEKKARTGPESETDAVASMRAEYSTAIAYAPLATRSPSRPGITTFLTKPRQWTT